MKRKGIGTTWFLTMLFLFGVGLWRAGDIPVEVSAPLQAVSVIIITLIILYKKPKIHLHFTKEIIVILFSVLSSTLMAFSFQQQDFATSFIEQRFMYFYLFYFALAHLDVPAENVEQALINTGMFLAALYILQYFLYPARIFWWPKVQIERGTYRFRVDGFELLIFMAVYALNKILEKNFIWFGLLILPVLVNLLSGSRYLLFTTTLAIGIVAYRTKVVSLFAKLIIVVVFIFSVFELMPKEYIEGISQASEKDLSKGEGYIRIPSARYYATQFNEGNLLTMLFGNGVADTYSPYGKKLASLGATRGFYISDVGIIGDFVRFGFIYIITICILLFRAIRSSFLIDKPIHAFLIGLSFLYLTSWFSHPAGIILLASILYIIDKKRHERKRLTEIIKMVKKLEIENNQNEFLEIR